MFSGIENIEVQIGAIDPDTKHSNHVDMLYVCAIARHTRAKRIFEFGTYLGRTTSFLALGKDNPRVFTLDLGSTSIWPSDLKIGRAVRAVHERGLQGYFFNGTPQAERITQLHGDSRTFDFAPYRASMDLIFIDGGHTYELIANDTKHAFEMIRPGGVIVWHDYAPKSRDVVTFGHELSQKKPLFWVIATSLLVYVDGVDAMTFKAEIPGYSRQTLKPE